MPTKIEWAEESWNPVTGCSPISEGCKNCYAARMAKRLAGRHGYPEAPHEFDVMLHEDKLDQPLRWKKPRTVFVCSMGDLFHEDVPPWYISLIWSVMTRTPQHTYLVLTKRADRMLEVMALYMRMPSPNIWLGVTAENQQRADERIPLLLQCPAARRFVSIEPMLGPVNLSYDWLRGKPTYDRLGSTMSVEMGGIVARGPRLSRIIVGGETGPGARPMHPTWVRTVRDQCDAAGVSFFFKSWGDWAPFDNTIQMCEAARDSAWVHEDGEVLQPIGRGCKRDVSTVALMMNVGKGKAGCELDGRTHQPAWPS